MSSFEAKGQWSVVSGQLPGSFFRFLGFTLRFHRSYGFQISIKARCQFINERFQILECTFHNSFQTFGFLQATAFEQVMQLTTDH